jgi:hypothetical protein
MGAQMDNKPDILQVAHRLSLSVKRCGKNHKTICCFHNEKTPSLYLYEDTNAFHCFGCGAHGDSIDLEMKLTGRTFKEVAGLSAYRRPPVEDKKKKLVRAFRQWERNYSDHVAMLLRGIRRFMAAAYRDMEAAKADAELFHALPVLEYHHEILCGSDEKKKYELFMEANNAAC